MFDIKPEVAIIYELNNLNGEQKVSSQDKFKSLGIRMKRDLMDKVDEKINVIRHSEDRNVSYSEVVREGLELWLEQPYTAIPSSVGAIDDGS